jgi:hypothetical protein
VIRPEQAVQQAQQPQQPAAPNNVGGGPYDTADEAARQALRDVANKSQRTRREYGGAIYEKDGKYYYTALVEGPPGTEEKRSCPINTKTPGNLVATYHTHVDHPLHSPPDKIKHDHLNRFSYVQRAGSKIQKYTPDPKKTANKVFGRGKVEELAPLPPTPGNQGK